MHPPALDRYRPGRTRVRNVYLAFVMSTMRLVNVTLGSVRPRSARERRLRPARIADDRMVAVMIERPNEGRPLIVRTRERERLQFLVARRLPPAVTVMPRRALRTAN